MNWGACLDQVSRPLLRLHPQHSVAARAPRHWIKHPLRLQEQEEAGRHVNWAGQGSADRCVAAAAAACRYGHRTALRGEAPHCGWPTPTFWGKPNCLNASTSCGSPMETGTPDSHTQQDWRCAPAGPPGLPLAPAAAAAASGGSSSCPGLMAGAGWPTSCSGGGGKDWLDSHACQPTYTAGQHSPAAFHQLLLVVPCQSNRSRHLMAAREGQTWAGKEAGG
jgi:hypothetical protein